VTATWLLAHREPEARDAIWVERAAPSSWDAIEALRAEIPGTHKILLVRRA